MGRALASGPRVLVLDASDRRGSTSPPRRRCSHHPGTRGRRGVLMVSDDLDELAICDRVLVMFRGRMVAEFGRTGATTSWSQRSREWSGRPFVAELAARHRPPDRTGERIRAFGSREACPGARRSCCDRRRRADQRRLPDHRQLPQHAAAVVGAVGAGDRRVADPDRRQVRPVAGVDRRARPDVRRLADRQRHHVRRLGPRAQRLARRADPRRRRADRRRQRLVGGQAAAQRLHRDAGDADPAARRDARHHQRQDPLRPAAAFLYLGSDQVAGRAGFDLDRRRSCTWWSACSSATTASGARSMRSAATPRRPAQRASGSRRSSGALHRRRRCWLRSPV